MSHYAKVVDGVVVDVIRADSDFIAQLPDSEAWIQTSYNSYGGARINPDTGEKVDNTHLRFNFAAIGGNYDSEADAFYASPEFDDWILNTDTYLWEPPIPKPEHSEDEMYVWENGAWVLVLWDGQQWNRA